MRSQRCPAQCQWQGSCSLFELWPRSAKTVATRIKAAVFEINGKPGEVGWQEPARSTVMRGVGRDKASSAKYLMNGLVCCGAAYGHGAEKLCEAYEAVCCDTHTLPI